MPRRRKLSKRHPKQTQARLVQLLARMIGVILTAAASRLPTDDADTIALAAAALAAFVFDLYSHQKQHTRKRRYA